MPLTVCVNPTIDVCGRSAPATGRAACLCRGCAASCRGRSTSASPFTDLRGERRSIVAKGFPRHGVQHEFDHLDGKLYVDRIADPRQLAFEEEYVRYLLPSDG